MDILSGFDKVKVATEYKLRGERICHVPAETQDFAEVEPIYTELEGWQGDLQKAKSLADLPKEARHYLDFMAEYTGTPVAVVSVGPARDETIIVRPDLMWG